MIVYRLRRSRRTSRTHTVTRRDEHDLTFIIANTSVFSAIRNFAGLCNCRCYLLLSSPVESSEVTTPVDA